MAGFSETSAVVTGASSGIGRQIAVALAQAGASRVVVHFHRNRQGAEQTAESIAVAGGEPILVAADLARAEDRQRLVETAFDRGGPIQTWVNNAGADVLTGAAAKLDFDAKLRQLIDVDVLGTIALSRAVSTALRKQRTSQPPSITFIGWDQAPLGMEGDAGQMFGATKAAVMAFAASLAQTVAPEIRVNTVAPGWIQTAWGQSASPVWDQRATSQALMGRWGTPGDVARAVLFVATPENSFLHGQTIEVNGGWNRKPSAPEN
jgi:3-oxoacyl-[acyl-carrier protein] reductase